MSKDLKFTITTKRGSIMAQAVVRFGNEETPFPKNWKTSAIAWKAIQDYEARFIEEAITVTVSEDLDIVETPVMLSQEDVIAKLTENGFGEAAKIFNPCEYEV